MKVMLKKNAKMYFKNTVLTETKKDACVTQWLKYKFGTPTFQHFLLERLGSFAGSAPIQELLRMLTLMQ